MSKKIGEISACAISEEFLTSDKPNWVTVLASLGGVELVSNSVNLHPMQARYLADLLIKAADEADIMTACVENANHQDRQ